MFELNDVSNWPKTHGIYCITNKVTGKIYIGQSRDTKGFKRRWGTHRVQLRMGIHDNPYLQNSYNKHGEENFHLSVLEEVSYSLDLEEILNLKEKEWIAKLNSDLFNYGYNTNITREHFQANQNKKETVLQFEFVTPDGKLISGQNIAGFARSIGAGQWGFRELQAGRKSSYMGYTLPNFDYENVTYKYCLISPEGVKHEFNSMGKFAKEIGVLESGLSLVILEKTGHYKGWRLENPNPKFNQMIEDYKKKIYIVMEDGKIHEFENHTSIRRKYSIGYTALKTILNGKRAKKKCYWEWRLATKEDFKNLETIQDGISLEEFEQSGGKKEWTVKGDSSTFLRPVDCFDLEGNFIKRFPSTSAAQKTIDYQRVKEAVKQPFKRQAGGFYWQLAAPLADSENSSN